MKKKTEKTVPNLQFTVAVVSPHQLKYIILRSAAPVQSVASFSHWQPRNLKPDTYNIENTRGLGKQYHDLNTGCIYSAQLMNSKKYFIKEQPDVPN